MIYDAKILQTEVNSLIGESIEDVFYHTDYDGFETFKNLENEIVEVPLLGVLLRTSSGNYYNIISYDYAPYYDLGGVRVFRERTFKSPYDRPSQINEIFWRNIKNRKILSVYVIENYYKKLRELITVPFGLKINFDNEEQCYILNMTIENFIKEHNLYEFCRGGELVLMSGNDTFNKYPNIKENIFNI